MVILQQFIVNLYYIDYKSNNLLQCNCNVINYMEEIMVFNLPSLMKSDTGSLWKNRRDIDVILDDILTSFYQSLQGTPMSKNIDGTFLPSIDISETDSMYHLEVEVPGVAQKDIDIKSENNILTITGKKEVKSDHKERNYYTQERFYGTFKRSITLPANIIENDITAIFKDGVLEINIPKKEYKSAKKIEVKS